MVRPTEPLAALLSEYECVRVTDMRGVDLTRFPFDFDLTFAALVMNADGHVYHRYGSRDERGADHWLSAASLEALLEATLAEHAAYLVEPRAPGPRAPLFLEEVPAYRRRDKGACIHCHSVFPALYEEARAADRWRPDDLWAYPPPGRIGLDLDRDRQALITEVRPESPAARAGLRVGDRLVRAGSQRLLTVSDLSHVLHGVPAEGGSLALELERDGQGLRLELELAAGWRRGTPLEFAWRPSKWGLSPAPGFGGQALDARRRDELGLPAEAFALRVTYLVTWGENRRFGQEAARAGLRNGDVVLSVAGRRDFASPDHLHAWWRLTRRPGEQVTLEVRRAGQPLELTLDVLR